MKNNVNLQKNNFLLYFVDFKDFKDNLEVTVILLIFRIVI